ncbi:hypothetical protein KI809_18800 [Geobacter pelophilus]|uniref:Mor transcription activator domain-containing protein n=1 Tax=Geoanaerobacter pelophilus TaxID=60036 RepID=A0AAW4L877_9BACT|nr:Mor transcription activator family protein [Geoanaerobacter pelophilus]MBT0666362.1 hypothetical protein [Geoanaerobacter pelophilus]
MTPDLTNYPDIFLDLIDKAEEPIAAALGVDNETARLAAFQVTEIMRRDWAGTQPYLSKGMAFELTNRDREMYEKFNGSNHEELALEFGMTTRNVYDRIKAIRAEEFKRRQPALFE